MKKIAVLAIALLIAAPSFASVGIWKNGAPEGTATDLEFTGDGWTNNGSRWTFPLSIMGTGGSGAVSMATSDTTISTSYSFIRKAISDDPAFGASTLADGSPGQVITFFITSVTGSGTWVLTPATSVQIATLTFDAAKESATLQYVDDTVGWVTIGNPTATLVIP